MAVELLDNRYAPITDAIGFIEADFDRVVAADDCWRASLGGYAGRSIRGTLPALLDALLPLTGPRLRYIWVPTVGPWTAYFDNFVVGSDPGGPVAVLAKRLGARGVHIGCRAGTSRRGAAVRGLSDRLPSAAERWLQAADEYRRGSISRRELGAARVAAWDHLGDRSCDFGSPEVYAVRAVLFLLYPDIGEDDPSDVVWHFLDFCEGAVLAREDAGRRLREAFGDSAA
jgi:hypothetical protein